MKGPLPSSIKGNIFLKELQSSSGGGKKLFEDLDP